MWVGPYLRTGRSAIVFRTEEEANAFTSQVTVFESQNYQTFIQLSHDERSQKNHSIEAILGIPAKKRPPSKISKSFVPYTERMSGKD